MRPASSSKLRARGGFWVMLCVAAVGSIGMQTLTMLAKQTGDEAWVDAVYRFNTDAIPSCELLAGRAQSTPGEGDVNWARLGGLGSAITVDGRCRLETRLVI